MPRFLLVGLAGAALVECQQITKLTAALGDLKQNVMQSIVESPSFTNLMQSIPESASFAGFKESVSDQVHAKVSGLTDSVLNAMPDVLNAMPDVQKLGSMSTLSSYYSSLISQTIPKPSVEELDTKASSDDNQPVAPQEGLDIKAPQEELDIKNSSNRWIEDMEMKNTSLDGIEGAASHVDILRSEVLIASTQQVSVEEESFQAASDDEQKYVNFANESEASKSPEESLSSEDASSPLCIAQQEHIAALEQEVERLLLVKNNPSQAARNVNESLLVVYPGVELLTLFLQALRELARQAYSVVKPQLKTSLQGVQPLVGGSIQSVASGAYLAMNHTLKVVSSVSNKSWATGSAMIGRMVNRSWSHCEELLTTALNTTHLAGVKWNFSENVNPAVREAFNHHLASIKRACADVNRDVVKPYMEVASVAVLETQKIASDWAADVAPMVVAKELGDFLWDVAQQEVHANVGPANLTLYDGTVIHFPYGLLDMTILGVQVVAMLWLVVWRLGFKILFWQILVQTLVVQFVIHTVLVGSLASVWALLVGTLYFAWMTFLGVADLMMCKCVCCCCTRRRKVHDNASWLSTFSVSVPLVSTVCLCTAARYCS
jgi:hypothetical protein